MEGEGGFQLIYIIRLFSQDELHLSPFFVFITVQYSTANGKVKLGSRSPITYTGLTTP